MIANYITQKNLTFIIICLFVNSCFFSNKKIDTTFNDSLIIKKESYVPDFVVDDYDTKILQELMHDTLYTENDEFVNVKIYYDKNKRVKRIIINDINYMINNKVDENQTYYSIYSYHPKSIIIDLSDTFKKYNIQYLDNKVQ